MYMLQCSDEPCSVSAQNDLEKRSYRKAHVFVHSFRNKVGDSFCGLRYTSADACFVSLDQPVFRNVSLP